VKLPDIIILSLAVGFLIIGIHQTMALGFGQAYWVLMLTLILFFWFTYRKGKAKEKEKAKKK
jgi:hypothetical protein